MIPRAPHNFSGNSLSFFVICPFSILEKNKKVRHSFAFSKLFIVLVYYALTQFRFVKNLKLTFNWFPLASWTSSAHKFSLVKMVGEAQKPLAKMECLLVCCYLATVSLESWIVLFGSLDTDNISILFNYILLESKYFICPCKLNKGSLCTRLLVDKFRKTFQTKHFIAKKLQQNPFPW